MHDKLLNETGGVSSEHERNNISNEDSNTSNDLVDVLGRISVKVNEVFTEGEKPHVFDETILTNMNEYNENELVEMTEKWLNIEDDEDVVNDDIEDMIREIENVDIIENENDSETDNKESSETELELKNVSTVTWNDTINALKDVKAYIQQENLVEDREIQVDKLIFDLQKIRVEKATKKKTCQDSIMKYMRK